MKSKPQLTLILSLLAVGLLAGPAGSARAAADESAAASAKDAELVDRDVDEAALSAQARAAQELGSLLKKYRGTPQEPVFLAKLADIQQQSAAMEFRVAHGKAKRTRRPVDLRAYKQLMGKSVPALSELIAKYPGYEEIAHICFQRGKAYEEMGDKAKSQRDYLHLIETWPGAPESVPARLSLADFAFDAGRYAAAIAYLRPLEGMKNDSHYPIALYKMAWAYYDLHDIPDALAISERLVGHYRTKQGARADRALLDNILHDVPVFYFGGFQLHKDEYPTPKALAFFRKLDIDSELGRMLTAYATLLRAHGYEQELGIWKDTLLAQEPRRPETLDVLMTTYEYQLHKRRYPDLVRSAQDIVAYYKKNGRNEYSAKAESMLLETAAALQKLMLENGSSEVLAQWLAPIYSAFTQIVGESDPRLRSIHANLGETLFAIKDYEGAAKSYRWIVEHYRFSETKVGGISVSEASLKSISSRYEYLRTRNLIPGELKARALPKSDADKIDPLVAEWVEWVDAHARRSAGAIDNFRFEANRCLYAQGKVNEATDRMKSFARKNPRSAFAIPSATLVMDTVIATQDWERLEALARELLSVSDWKGNAFYNRLYTIAADAKYKRVEQLSRSKQYQEALKEANEFAGHYSNSEHLADTLTLAGNSALALHNRTLAVQYYAKLAATTRGSQISAQATLKMARLEEERYGFTAAAGDYLAYLSLPASLTHLDAKEAQRLKRRVLVLSWLSGDPALLGRMLRDRSICDGRLGSECNRYHALTVLMGTGQVSPQTSAQAIRLAQSSAPDVRPIYAAIALENAGRMSMDTRHRMIHELAAGWKQLDELARFSLISRISTSVPRAFALDRESIPRSGRLQANERSLTRRLNLTREMESSATQAARLPWSRIRALVLNEVAWVYNDLADGIRHLPPPANIRRLDGRGRLAYQRMVDQLVAPFENKAQQIRSEAFRLAAQTGVESEVYDRIASDLLRADPRKSATAVVPKQSGAARATIDLSLVRDTDRDGSWRPVDLDSAEPAQILRAKWAEALERRQWAQVAFFAEEAREKSLLSPETIGVAKAVSIAYAGARAEGAMALNDLCRGGRGGRLPKNLMDACGNHGRYN